MSETLLDKAKAVPINSRHLHSRSCSVCYKIQYAVDFMDILGNQVIK